MPVYAYKGVTQAGRNARGFVDADSARAARAKLRRDGVFLTDLSESAAQEKSVASDAKSRNVSLGLSRFRRVSPGRFTRAAAAGAVKGAAGVTAPKHAGSKPAATSRKAKA